MTRRILLSATLVATLSSSFAAPPAWWASRGATNAYPINDSAPVNQGQLKHFTQKAVLELNSRVPGCAGPELDELISLWVAGHPDPDDFSAITVGQMKWVASSIHQRLLYLRYEDNIPDWLPSIQPMPPDPADLQLANLGQLKTVFDFDLSAPEGGLAEWWKKYYSGEEEDYDGDGWTNGYEVTYGSNPLNPDTDGDGIPDGTDPHPLSTEVGGAGTSVLIVWTNLEN